MVWLVVTHVVETCTGFLLNYLCLALTGFLLLGSSGDVSALAMYWTLS